MAENISGTRDVNAADAVTIAAARIYFARAFTTVFRISSTNFFYSSLLLFRSIFFSRAHQLCNSLFNFVSASLVQLIIKLNCSVNIQQAAAAAITEHTKKIMWNEIALKRTEANINTWCALNYANGLFCHSFKLSETRKWRSVWSARRPKQKKTHDIFSAAEMEITGQVKRVFSSMYSSHGADHAVTFFCNRCCTNYTCALSLHSTDWWPFSFSRYLPLSLRYNQEKDIPRTKKKSWERSRLPAGRLFRLIPSSSTKSGVFFRDSATWVPSKIIIECITINLRVIIWKHFDVVIVCLITVSVW